MVGSLATGHPPIPTDGGFDVAPLVIAVLLIVGVRISGFRLRPWMIPAVLLLGLILDDVSDATGDSTITAVALIVAVSCAAALRRPIVRRRPDPAV